MDRRFDATYKNVADATGLKLNTVKNYRTQLLNELRVHGLFDPSLREMRDFAWRCRAFLKPHIDKSLGNRVVPPCECGGLEVAVHLDEGADLEPGPGVTIDSAGCDTQSSTETARRSAPEKAKDLPTRGSDCGERCDAR